MSMQPRHNRLSLSFQLLRMQFVFFCFYRFVYKTTAMPNPKKKRSVLYPSLNYLLDARNAIQPRRKERSSAKFAAARPKAFAEPACGISSESLVSESIYI